MSAPLHLNRKERDIEAEADQFASTLLMPLDDFRHQVDGESISFDLLGHCADRYGVSLTAAALRWTQIAPGRAVLVASRDDHLLWAKSSKAAFKSGAYFATHNRQFLERRIAYKLQESAFRTVDPELLERNARRIQALIETGNRPKRDRELRLLPGTVLTREYRGIEHHVAVAPDGQYEYQGRRYPSLSMIAREITGTRWSGPLFFGLKGPAKPKTQKKRGGQP
jgi:hypothetical protein